MPPGMGMLAQIPQQLLQYSASAPSGGGGGILDLLKDQAFLKKLMESGAFGSLLGSLGGKSERRPPPMSAGVGSVAPPRFSLLDSMRR